MKVLMVCLGNICRSPLAEGVLQYKVQKAGLTWEVDSAGTGNWHIGKAPHELSQEVARQNGVDITKQKARQFKKEDLLDFDRIYFMDAANMADAKKMAGNLWDASKCDLLLNELYENKGEPVPDPYGYPFTKYEEVYRLIDAACDQIVTRFIKNASA